MKKFILTTICIGFAMLAAGCKSAEKAPTPTAVPATNAPVASTKAPEVSSTPMATPTSEPTKEPTKAPTIAPTTTATPVPTNIPTSEPTVVPTNTPTPVPTNTSKPTVTSIPTSTPTPASTSTPIPTPTNTPMPTVTPTPTPKYTYQDVDEVMYVKKDVNFRDLPSTEGEKLGKLHKDEEIVVFVKCNETGWYGFEHKDYQTLVFVSGNYLTKTPPATPTPTPVVTPKPQLTVKNLTNMGVTLKNRNANEYEFVIKNGFKDTIVTAFAGNEEYVDVYVEMNMDGTYSVVLTGKKDGTTVVIVRAESENDGEIYDEFKFNVVVDAEEAPVVSGNVSPDPDTYPRFVKSFQVGDDITVYIWAEEISGLCILSFEGTGEMWSRADIRKTYGTPAPWERPNLVGKIVTPIEIYYSEGITIITSGTADINMKAVHFPSTVKRIEASAFEGCIGITRLHLPEGLEFVGEAAFMETYALEELILPSTLQTIEDWGFCFGYSLLRDTNQLKEVVLPKSLTYVGYNVFGGRPDIKIILQDGINTSKWDSDWDDLE